MLPGLVRGPSQYWMGSDWSWDWVVRYGDFPSFGTGSFPLLDGVLPTFGTGSFVRGPSQSWDWSWYGILPDVSVIFVISFHVFMNEIFDELMTQLIHQWGERHLATYKLKDHAVPSKDGSMKSCKCLSGVLLDRDVEFQKFSGRHSLIDLTRFIN